MPFHGNLFKGDTVMLGIGAGLAGTIGGLTSRFLPVSGDIAQLAGALALGAFGSRIPVVGKFSKNLAKGALIKTIGDFVEGFVVSGQIPGLTQGAFTGTIRGTDSQVIGQRNISTHGSHLNTGAKQMASALIGF